MEWLSPEAERNPKVGYRKPGGWT